MDIDELRKRCEAAGIDTSNMSDEEIEKLADTMLVVARTVATAFREVMSAMAIAIRPIIAKLTGALGGYVGHQNRMAYRKKRSQQRNWRKWKKRRR